MSGRQRSEIEQFIRSEAGAFLSRFSSEQAAGFAVGYVTPDFPSGDFFFVSNRSNDRGQPLLYRQDRQALYVLNEDSNFAIASITKTFTTTYLYAVRDWDETRIGEFHSVPPWLQSRDFRQIRFIDLLNYTSGLPQDSEYPQDQPEPLPQPYRLHDLQFFLSDPDSVRAGRSGRQYTYSNLAYAIAVGMANHLGDGAPFESDIKYVLLDPLGIDAGFVLLARQNDDDYYIDPTIQLGYALGSGAPQPVEPDASVYPAYHPPGGLVMSARGMMTWLRANMNPRGLLQGVTDQNQLARLGTVVDAIARAQTKSPEVEEGEPRPHRATSWFLTPRAAPRYYSKNGKKRGTQSFMCFRAPEVAGAPSEYGVFVLCNASGARNPADALGQALADYLSAAPGTASARSYPFEDDVDQG